MRRTIVALRPRALRYLLTRSTHALLHPHRTEIVSGPSTQEWLDRWTTLGSLSDPRSRHLRRALAKELGIWVAEGTDFESTKGRMADILSDPRVRKFSVDELLGVRTLIGAIGLFTLTENLLDIALQTSRYQMRKSRSNFEIQRAISGLLCEGKLAEARHVLQGNSEHLLPEANLLFRDYISACTFSAATSEPHTIVIGPGPVGTFEKYSPRSASTVCRVLMPGVTDWTHGDVLDGRVTDVYANGETSEWFWQLAGSEREELLRKAQRFHLKRIPAHHAVDTRIVQTKSVSALFFSGIPNMVPLIVLSRLASLPGGFQVSGTTFFAGVSPYRADQRRDRLALGSSDEFGGVERRFDRCVSHSLHDQAVNRRLIRNLGMSGWLSGDELFERALWLDEPDYLGELESTYGRVQR